MHKTKRIGKPTASVASTMGNSRDSRGVKDWIKVGLPTQDYRGRIPQRGNGDKRIDLRASGERSSLLFRGVPWDAEEDVFLACRLHHTKVAAGGWRLEGSRAIELQGQVNREARISREHTSAVSRAVHDDLRFLAWLPVSGHDPLRVVPINRIEGVYS